MSVAEIAQSLVDLCRAGKFEQPYDTLFAENARSVEGTGESVEGLAAIKVKSAEWGENNVVHGFTVNGPFVGTDQFAVHFVLEITPKRSGEKMSFVEVGVYAVADGKIVEEKFLYGA
ncbi:MAG: nuclear transport factor 2 family protein [Akkermansiaceae bacterium]|nr:nuclear transport factor 2 family protein [Armatimonadota bacterium]